MPGLLKRHYFLPAVRNGSPDPSEGSEQTDCPVRRIDCQPENQLAMSRQTGAPRSRDGRLHSG